MIDYTELLQCSEVQKSYEKQTQPQQNRIAEQPMTYTANTSQSKTKRQKQATEGQHLLPVPTKYSLQNMI